MTQIIDQGESLKLNLNGDESLLVRRSRNPSFVGCQPSFYIPKPGRCSVPRLMSGFFSANRIVADENETAEVVFQRSKEKNLVLLELDDEDVVAVRLDRLICYSEQIQLTTAVEFSWTAFASMKNFIQLAFGPGRIVLELHGSVDVKHAHIATFSPDRLIAWTPSCVTFSLSGISRWWDVWMSNVLLEVKSIDNGGLAIIDADAFDNQSRVVSMVRMLRNVFSPF